MPLVVVVVGPPKIKPKEATGHSIQLGFGKLASL
jgi:hypothetical protein